MQFLKITNIDPSTSVFWDSGNNPTQELNCISEQRVRQELICHYLLSKHVVAASSFYLESEITRSVTKELWPLFNSQEIVYFIDDDLENIQDHARKKIDKSPKESKYRIEKQNIDSFAKELDTLGYGLKRPRISISDAIVNAWVRDLNSSKKESLGQFLKTAIASRNIAKKLIDRLIAIALNRSCDFVWESIQPVIQREFDLNADMIRFIRKRLATMYTIATSQVLGMNVGRAVSLYDDDYISIKSKYDPDLFIRVIKLLGIEKDLFSLTWKELGTLKAEFEFRFFRDFYFDFIDVMSYDCYNIDQYLVCYEQAEKSYANKKVSKAQFLGKFLLTFKISERKYVYQKPLDKLLSTFDSFMVMPIRSFQRSVKELSLLPPPNHVQLPSTHEFETMFQIILESLQRVTDDQSMIVAKMEHDKNELNLLLTELYKLSLKFEPLMSDADRKSSFQYRALASSPDLVVKHKLVYTLPLIPLLLKYEGELNIEGKKDLRNVFSMLFCTCKALLQGK